MKKEIKSLKILAIGNSFSVDSMEFLWNIANSYGYEFILGNLFIGGCDLETHSYNARNNLPLYIYYKNKDTDGNWTERENASILDAISDEKWDIITLQQVSGKSGLSESYSPFLENIIAYVHKFSLNEKVKIGWNMTWAYAEESDHGDFEKYSNDQIHMYDSIIEAVKEKILKNKEIDFIIPTGTTIQNARTSFLGDNLNRDGFHLSYDLGRFIAGMTWFSSISGKFIDEIKYTPKEMPSKVLEVVKEAVNNAIKRPFHITNSKII